MIFICREEKFLWIMICWVDFKLAEFREFKNDSSAQSLKDKVVENRTNMFYCTVDAMAAETIYS